MELVGKLDGLPVGKGEGADDGGLAGRRFNVGELVSKLDGLPVGKGEGAGDGGLVGRGFNVGAAGGGHVPHDTGHSSEMSEPS